jgi:hypothetical protein
MKKAFVSALLGLALPATGALAAVTVETTILPAGSNRSVDSGAMDFIIYNSNGSGTTVRKNGGGERFSSLLSDGSLIATDGDPNNTLNLSWSGGTPTASGTTEDCLYAGMGSSFNPQSTYIATQVTMPGSNAQITVWTRPNGNTQSISFDVSMGKTGNLFEASYNRSDASAMIFDFTLSGFTAGDTVEFRVDNVSGSNTWHNFAIYGAEIIPEPSTWLLLAISGVTIMVFARKRSRGIF